LDNYEVGASIQRDLDWDGCFNVRDLGGLATVDGAATRWGALVRADALDGLTSAGWAALVGHGVRTVVDLRNDDELGPDAAPRPAAVTTFHLPLDGTEDREFWDVWDRGPQFGTPLYYQPHLERFPERSARVITAIANARPGGVAFHCGGGRDRAGQIAMLVLALVGVSPEEIVADYELSTHRVRARYAARGERDQGALLKDFLASKGTTAGEVILATLAVVDIEATLRAGGLGEPDVTALRARLLGI
jgi:protein-tyrosine phosphatase